MQITRERLVAASWGLLFCAILAVLIIAGSRTLQHFDAALVGYTFATLFATFGITYRYSMWLQRPPTRLYWRRGWQVFFKRGHFLKNSTHWVARVTSDFAFNRFIFFRNRVRWAAHFALMWGCILAAAITFPLVFGWVHFETLPNNVNWYRAYLFGIPTAAFPIHSIPAFLTFHGLVWSAFFVIFGVMLAMRRRMRDHGAAAVQQFGEDFLPLFLLFAISITGLMLTASYTWMKGYAYDFLAILHACTVIFTLLWLPFGKFFHIFQRPAQLGVAFYKKVGAREGDRECVRCRQKYATAMHIADLIEVERQLGYHYEIAGGHYQTVCPQCRRTLLGIAQGNRWEREILDATGDPLLVPAQVDDPFGDVQV